MIIGQFPLYCDINFKDESFTVGGGNESGSLQALQKEITSDICQVPSGKKNNKFDYNGT